MRAARFKTARMSRCRLSAPLRQAHESFQPCQHLGGNGKIEPEMVSRRQAFFGSEVALGFAVP